MKFSVLTIKQSNGMAVTGSWFVLERWIAESPFREAHAPGQSDLDVAKGGHPKEILENHWDTWITTNDWDWLASIGINSVRIPVSSSISTLVACRFEG